ncbi:hypothetical protein SPWS13_0489 [Shewanella putrefaciens]|nr:hypothetical protein SPWS13_0489 [Shewanella putrefaciens]
MRKLLKQKANFCKTTFCGHFMRCIKHRGISLGLFLVVNHFIAYQ